MAPPGAWQPQALQGLCWLAFLHPPQLRGGSLRAIFVPVQLRQPCSKEAPNQPLADNGIELVYFSMSTEKPLSKERNLPRGFF